MSSFSCLVRLVSPAGETRYALGDPLVDRYLEFVAGRCRSNTLTATAFDLKTFFTVVGREPVAVTSADVFEFLAAQLGDRKVVRISDRESGLSARTIARRLSTVSGFYAYLVAVVTRRWRRIRCRVGCRLVVRRVHRSRPRCRWCECRGRCRRSCPRCKSTP
jgi:Phage integrase, N-terminal SAM-like domain